MSLDPEQLRARVVALEIEHRDLDEAISRLTDLPNRDDLLLTRMKKRKLQLKDQVLQLKMLLVPDIPA
ncbi:MAG: YdcH family protein [Burkholderiaceae bacterium]